MELAQQIFKGTGFKRCTTLPQHDSFTSNNYIKKKIAHNVSVRLKDEEQTFCGNLPQFWADDKNVYEQISEACHLPDDQEL